MTGTQGCCKKCVQRLAILVICAISLTICDVYEALDEIDSRRHIDVKSHKLSRHPRDTSRRHRKRTLTERYGNAIYFNGNGLPLKLRFLTKEGKISLPNEHFTVQFWAKPEGGQSSYTPIVVVSGVRDARLVLSSDQDIHQVITSIQTELSALKSETATLKSENQALKSETATLKSDNQALKSKVSNLESNTLSAPQASGSVYVRWGRTSCPGNGTDMIYSGQMAGNQYDLYGGGSNSLCLPNDPTWGQYVDGLDTLRSRIHGTEIDLSNANAQILFGHNVYNEDIPCAVCRSSRASSVMVPARVNCYSGWTKEYQGYVASSDSNWHNNVDYVCLDAGLEFSAGGVGNDNEHVMVLVEAVCGKFGPLQCPPYVNGRELACVVCSK